jgi:hypothetical protein
MNPFTPNLSDLSDEELLKKINELYAKMRIVMNNPPVYRQMASVMDDYQFEQRTRLHRKMVEFEKSELNKKIDIGQ